MRRMLKFVELAWVIIAIISAVEVYRMWGVFDQKFWLFVGCMFVAIVMFFIRRKQRIRYDQRMKEEGNQQE